MREPWSSVYRLDMTSSRSLVFFTGKNLELKRRISKHNKLVESMIIKLYLDLGTFIPEASSKHFIAAPTAVSSW